MQLRAVTVSLLPLALATFFVAVRAEAPRRLTKPSLIYTSTPRYDAMAWLRGGDSFPAGAGLMLHSGGRSRSLVPGFAASADANVSFDGASILFAGKKSASDHWQIWQMPIGGGEPRQLTSCADDCVRPFYLPQDRIVYAHRVDGGFQIEASPAGRGTPLRLTYAAGNALPTDVLHDGRILFEAAYPLGEGTTAELYTVYPDGSGLESYRCDHGDSRHSGKQDASGDIVFATDKGLARFTSALAHEVKIETPAGEFAGDTIQASGHAWVVSWRRNSTANYSLQEWNATAKSLKPIAAESGRDLVQPQLVSSREIPNRFPSALHDWDGANVLCLNVYTSKMPIASGTVKALNLYTLADHQPKLLGRAEVEPDGSFFLHVPSNQPLRIELLNGSGNAVQSEHGWFWMARGEQRVCVGCHAGPERAPENAVPQVLVKSTEPADMTHHAIASKGGR
jgi:Hydrazine synthase alpha subunit middle domain